MRPRRSRAGSALASSPWIVACLVAFVGCGDSRAPAEDGLGTSDTNDALTGPITFVDAAGVEHSLAAPARRIVSLVPSATATLNAIGAGTSLVGRTDYDEGDWLRTVPSVGGGLDPNLEAVLALRPDVVIRFEGEQDPRTPARLDEHGIRHVAVRPASLEDVFTTTRIVGLLTGRATEADSLAASIRAGLDEVRTTVAPLPRRRVLYTLGGAPPWVSGPRTFVSDILTLAGGDNVFDDLDSPWAAVSPEAVRTRAIEVVLIPEAGSFDTTLTPGARIEVVGSLLDLPGPDVASAARRAAELIHGLPARE